MSKSVCLIPIIGCLNVSEEILGPERTWHEVNETQTEFLKIFSDARSKIASLPEIKSIASYDAAAINKFLSDNGFSLQLPAIEHPDFGVASLINILIEWLEEGEETKIKDYPGVYIEDAKFWKHPDLPNPIVRLFTKSDDQVFMSMIDDPPENFQLLELIAKAERSTCCFDYKGVEFPMIDYDQEIDISWIKGLNTVGDDKQLAIITQALQQTKFKMNEIGARVQSAVAMVMARCLPKPRLVIDKPFLLWIYRRDTLGDTPLFVGYFTEEVWKKPKKL
jgi:hypothetical protein